MAAPKGNKYALGNKGGKPAFYNNAEEMEKAVIEYFDNCIELQEPYTITGLALALGFSTRKSLLDYSEKQEFVNIIKRAKLVVENGYEIRLSSNSPAGSIFALKNMDWSDKSEIENINPKLPDLSGLTYEQLVKLSNPENSEE